MLSLGQGIAKAAKLPLQYIKDNLKLYLDFKSNKSDTLKFPCEGSTYFDGNDYISVADNDGFTFADGTAITISIWFKTSEATDEMFIFDMRSGWANASGISVLLDGNATNYLGFFADGSASASFTNTTDYHDGKWHHLASTFDGTSVATSYIDGVSVGTDTQALGAINCDDLVIGMGQDKSSSGFQGYLANFAIWSRALSVEEINSIMRKNYSQLGSVEKTSLVSWWALDDIYLGSTTNASDSDQAIYDIAKIMEDKNGSVGSNLVPDGEFESGVDNWTVTSGTISLNGDGNMLITGVGGTASAKLNALTLETNTVYLLEIGIAGGTDTSINVRYDDEEFGETKYGGIYSNASEGTNASPKNVSSTFTSHSSNTGFYLNIGNVGDGSTAIISHVKLYKVTSGNYGSIFGATTTTSVYGGNAPVLPRAVDVAKEGEAEQIGDGSALFNGSSDYISIADNDLLSMDGDQKFSICAWVNMDDATDFGIISKGVYNSTGEYIFDTSGSDKLRLTLMDESVSNTYEASETSSAITSYENEWTHIACTYNGVGGTSANAGIKLYINGISQAVSLTDSGTYVAMENLGADLFIGKYDTSLADGNISQVGIWKGELTQAQVQSVMESTSYAKIPASVKSTLGSNVVVNGTFDADSNWSKGTGWTITDGKARCDGSATGNTNLQTSVAPLTSGKLYKVTFDLTRSAGNFRFLIGSSGSSDYYTTDGTHSFYKVEDGNDHVYAQGDSNFVGTLDNVIIKEVTCDIVGYWALDAVQTSDFATKYVPDSLGGELGSELFTGWENNPLESGVAYKGWSSFTTSGETVTASQADEGGVYNKVFNTETFSVVAGTAYEINMTVDSVASVYIRGFTASTNSESSILVHDLLWTGLTSGVKKYVLLANTTSSSARLHIRQFGANTASITISAISIKPLSGNYGRLL